MTTGSFILSASADGTLHIGMAWVMVATALFVGRIIWRMGGTGTKMG